MRPYIPGTCGSVGVLVLVSGSVEARRRRQVFEQIPRNGMRTWMGLGRTTAWSDPWLAVDRSNGPISIPHRACPRLQGEALMTDIPGYV